MPERLECTVLKYTCVKSTGGRGKADQVDKWRSVGGRFSVSILPNHQVNSAKQEPEISQRQ